METFKGIVNGLVLTAVAALCGYLVWWLLYVFAGFIWGVRPS